MSTKFWRQKYHNLCTDIDILVESVGEKIEEAEHQIDVDIILNRMREFIKNFEEFKANYNKLSKQVKSGQIYCKTLIQLRDKLCLEIKTLKDQNFKFSKNVESLEDKCFLQNKIIVAFEELFHQRNETSKLIKRNINLNNELKKYKTLMASVRNIDQIESTVKQVLDLNSVLEEEVKQSISVEEKAVNLKVANQVICELKDILISETKLNSENDSLNKSCDSSHSSGMSFSTPESESKKRRYSLRSGSEDPSSIGSFQYKCLSSDSFDSISEKKRALQQSSDEKQSRKQPKRKAKSNRKLFPDYNFN
jgi:hypothetical protein